MIEPLVRAEGYRLLAWCFRYPDTHELRGELAGAAAAPEALSAFTELAPLVDDDLCGEYNRLFATNVAVPPYETSWLVGDKGSRLGQISALYEAFGARSGGTEKEHPDHIGTELEFASLVCLKEALAGTGDDAEVCRAAHRIALREHLGRWAPIFVERLLESTGHPFYLGAARVLQAWIERDLDDHGWTAEAAVLAPPAEEEACVSCPMARPET